MTKSMKAQDLAQQMVGGKLSEIANYSDLFQKTNDAIFLLDIDNQQLLESNPAAAKLLGANESLLTSSWPTCLLLFQQIQIVTS